jgi:hypothetical protein
MTATPLSVEIGSGGTVVVRYGDLTLSLSQEAASLLGRALIAASTALQSSDPLPAGFHVVDAHLPVQAWKTGVSNVNLEPVLVLEVKGGLKLSFQIPPTSANELGTALTSTGTTAGRPPGQLLS